MMEQPVKLVDVADAGLMAGMLWVVQKVKVRPFRAPLTSVNMENVALTSITNSLIARTGITQKQ